MKAVAKARAEGKPIDLSTLPPAIREKLEAQLKKLPPEAREQLQRGGLAKVDQIANRVANRAGSPVGTPVMPKFHSHFNSTIQPGDSARFPWSWLIGVLLVGAVLWKFYA